MLNLEVFQLEHGGYGYRVGACLQLWLPGVSGFIPMTEEQATAEGNAVLQILQQAD